MCVEEAKDKKPAPPHQQEENFLALTSQAALVSSCEDAEAEEESPFEVIYRLNLKSEEGRTVFFSRHGESEFNVQERIGGDPPLTKRGEKYAKALGQYINALELSDVHIWTSTLRRTVQTAAHIDGPRSRTPLLDEIKSGFLDSYTYREIEAEFPEEWEARERDKLRYRYPGGESYVDCCRRILPLLVEMEQRVESDLVIVAHQAVLRCVFGYLLRKPLEDVPFVKIPQHAIIQVTMENGENLVDFIRMPISHVEQGVTVASQDQPMLGNASQEFLAEKGGKVVAASVVANALSESPRLC